ncbi:MAG: right-handed parallel beta-helix repeat-containing protein, partial [Acidobacteria bacterium]|nr:right-handed parallel beta-helix repeat-containing protein [Acidobacteriota bacterium]
YYLSTSGSDTNNGTSPATAWATFSQADSVAVSGDTVRALNGTYYLGTPGQTSDCIHTYSSGVTWTSDTKWGAKIVCQAARGANAAIWVIAGDNETVMNFDLSSNSTQNLGLIVYSFSSNPLKGNNTLIKGNKVHDMPHDGSCTDFGDGISVQTEGLSGVVIDANVVFNIGPWSSTSCSAKFGITSKGNAVISNNIVYHSSGGGIELHCCQGGAVATNNTLFNNTRAGIVVDTTSGNTIQNNIIYNNGTIATKTCGIDDYNVPSPGTTISNNLLYGNQPANYCVTDVAGSTPAGQALADPQFVNYQGDGSGDYHLTSTSAAIDSGTSTNGPAFDYDGVPRPQGSHWDIGAFEFVPR